MINTDLSADLLDEILDPILNATGECLEALEENNAMAVRSAHTVLVKIIQSK